MNEYTELEALKIRCDELQGLLAALVKVCEMWPGAKNPEFFPEMKAARKSLAGLKSKETWSPMRLRALKAEAKNEQLVKAVMDWAKTPGDHGGNPYCKSFVKIAMEMSKEEAKQLSEFLTT